MCIFYYLCEKAHKKTEPSVFGRFCLLFYKQDQESSIFPVSNWKIVVVCVPSDSVCDISIASSYGNFIENGKVCSGPKAISVAGANGKDEINYKMWVIQTPGLNDPDSFTFKTV